MKKENHSVVYCPDCGKEITIENSTDKSEKANQSTKFKKILLITLISVMILVIFITLMTCLVGIRGTYVSKDNPNVFFSITATEIEFHIPNEEMMGVIEDVEKAKWSKHGSELKLSYKDELFDADNKPYKKDEVAYISFSTSDSYKKVILAGAVEFERVSLVAYPLITKKATVKFISQGKEIQSTKSTIGAKVKTPETPERDDATFVGWNTNPYGYQDGDGEQFNPLTRIWESTTYYANWYNSKNYTVSIEDEGLTFNAREGEKLLEKLKSNETDGYTYDYSVNGEIIDENFRMPAESITVSRKNPTPKTFTAHFNANGGAYSGDTELSVTYGTSFTLPQTKPVSADEFHVFGGWTLDGEDNYDSGAVIDMTSAQDLYFTAVWKHIFEYERYSYNYLSITGYNGTDTKITIPGSIDGKTVVTIGISAFADNKSLTEVELPLTVSLIDATAFFGCTSLKKINLERVTSIGEKAFKNCTSLVAVTLSKNLNVINEKAFEGCSAEIAWGENASYTSLDSNAFYGYTGTSVTLPESLTSIGAYAFANCPNLKTLIIPSSVTNIGASAFENSAALSRLTFADGSQLSNIANRAFFGCAALTALNLPDVTSIGESAFERCSAIISWSPTATIISIGQKAFKGYTGTQLTLPASLRSIEESAFEDCKNLTSIVIPRSVTAIGFGSLRNCTSLTQISLPFLGYSNGGTSNKHFGYIFGANAYSYNNIYVPAALKKVTLTYAEEYTIAQNAFYGCRNIEEIIVPNTVTSIGISAFAGCSALKSITLPFVGMSATETTNSHFGYIFGANTSGNNSTTVPQSLKTVRITGGAINSQAFYSCSYIKTVILANGVTEIKTGAFSYCTSLNQLYIANSVTTVAAQAILRCANVNKVLCEAASIPSGWASDWFDIDSNKITWSANESLLT